MVFYIFNFIQTSIFSFLYSKSKNKWFSVIFLICTFLSITLPVGLRYGIGQDYSNYVIGFERIIQGKYVRGEIGFVLICKLVQKLGFSVQLVFFIFAFLTFYFLFKSIDKKYFFLCIPLYFLTCYNETYNIIRQCLAASICLYGTRCIIDKKYNKAFLLYIFASCFHLISLFFILLFLLFHIRIDYRRNSYLIFLFILIIFSYYSAIDLLNILLPDTKYSFYLVSDYMNKSIRSTGIGVLISYIVYFLFIYLLNNITISSIKTRISYIMIFSMLIFKLLMQQVRLFYRFEIFLFITYMIIITECYKSNNKYRKIILIVIYIIYFILFFKSLLDNQVNNIPYRSILG